MNKLYGVFCSFVLCTSFFVSEGGGVTSTKDLNSEYGVFLSGESWRILGLKTVEGSGKTLQTSVLDSLEPPTSLERKTDQEKRESLRSTSVKDLLENDHSQVKTWVFGMSKHAHHDQIKQILKEEANLVAEHEFYSTLTTRSLNPEEEEKNNEIDEKLLENWKRWYAYKVLSVRFGDDEAKSELDNTIQSKITALESIYYSIENDEETGSHELGIKAENFYKKEVAFLDSVKDYGV